MSPAMLVKSHKEEERLYQQGVRRLCESGIERLPNKYILPFSDRPEIRKEESCTKNRSFRLPVIDFAELQGPNRSKVLKSLGNACEQYGFFQVANHGVCGELIERMKDVCKRFFELPFDERMKYMTADMSAPVRYGTSYNQSKDKVFCWRDFLKLVCDPLPDVLPQWPSSPADLRKLALAYSKETEGLFLMLMEAILESLGVSSKSEINPEGDDILKQLQEGSQLMVVNCFPPCPEPDLTLGMPPHSDYGFLTLLLQDEVRGLQVQHQGRWVTVEPTPNTFIVNVGDHLEIFSNGRYKSVLHRVVVNSNRTRVTVASLHSLPFECKIRPSSELIDEENPRRYKDTDFPSFLEYISSREPKQKDFLESRKLAFSLKD